MNNAQKMAGRSGNETTPRRANGCGCRRIAFAMATGATLNFFVSPSVFGDGFRNSTIGGFDLGRSGGRIAQVDDSTAAIQNPANLVDVTNLELNFTPSFIYDHASFKSVTGVSVDSKNPWKALPDFTASMPLGSNYAVGFAFTIPYGIATEWNTDIGGPFRPASGPGLAPYFTELKTFNFSPSFSAKICEHLQLGVGLDVMYSHLRFNQFLNGTPSLEAEAVGMGWGFGGNAGLTWEITDRQRLALTYRAPMTVEFGGDLKFTGLENAATSFNSQIVFPTIVAIGYGYQITENIRVESDLEWIEFSRFKTLPVNVGPNPFVPSSSTPENWKNTITIGVGGDWKFAREWTVRGGYQYFQSPVPDNTLTPTIPDANQNVLTVGLNYHHQHHTLEFAYGLDFYDHRNAAGNPNPALNGSYDFDVHLFTLSYRYSF